MLSQQQYHVPPHIIMHNGLHSQNLVVASDTQPYSCREGGIKAVRNAVHVMSGFHEGAEVWMHLALQLLTEGNCLKFLWKSFLFL